MPTPKKEAIVQQLSERLGRANAVYLADFKGMNVAKMSDLRAKLRKADAELTVVKNSLIHLSMKDTPWSAAGEDLAGPTSVTLAYGEAPPVAKVLKTFAKQNRDLPVIKAIGYDGAVHPADFLATLASMPTREEALGMLAGVLNSIIASSARVFNALREKVEAEGVETPGQLGSPATVSKADASPAVAETAAEEPAAEAGAGEEEPKGDA